jgi:hypothetical protein
MTTQTVELSPRTIVSPPTVGEWPQGTVDLDDLAYRLASTGPVELEAELARFARYALAAGASPLLVAILGDQRQPDVARQRAFGRIACELARPWHTRSHGPNDVLRAA